MQIHFFINKIKEGSWMEICYTSKCYNAYFVLSSLYYFMCCVHPLPSYTFKFLIDTCKFVV